MREIKFRAWDKSANRMFYDYPLRSIKPSNKIPLMQYTGLKDKNGKEIYEGDICDTPSGKRIVTYDAPSFWLAENLTDKVAVDAFSTPSVLEHVIGNIYENPELLK